MAVITSQITLHTRGNGDIIDITREVAEAVASSEITSGTVTVFIAGATAGVTSLRRDATTLDYALYYHLNISNFRSLTDN